jgi:hypothetical protein
VFSVGDCSHRFPGRVSLTELEQVSPFLSPTPLPHSSLYIHIFFRCAFASAADQRGEVVMMDLSQIELAIANIMKFNSSFYYIQSELITTCVCA